MKYKLSAYSIHCCPLDKECRSYGAPWRIHLNCPWAHFGFAIRPSSKFAYMPPKRDRWTTAGLWSAADRKVWLRKK